MQMHIFAIRLFMYFKYSWHPKKANFKILIYRRILILTIAQFNDLKTLLSTLIGAAFNGKNMLPIVTPDFSMNYFGQNCFFLAVIFSKFLMELKRRPLSIRRCRKNS